MSLTLGLTIGFAVAGAASGAGLKVISEFGGFALGIADAFARGALGTKNMTAPASLPVYIFVGAFAGAALGAGGGWLYEGGAETIYDGAAEMMTSTEQTTASNNCLENAPVGSEVTLTTNADGSTKCVVKIPAAPKP